MKKNYFKPFIELLLFDEKDVILTSGEGTTLTDGDGKNEYGQEDFF